VEIISHYLNSNKGKIHELLIETQYTNHVPWIVFVYDLQEANEHEVFVRLKKCQQELADFSQNEENIEKESINCQKEDAQSEQTFKLDDQISFEDPIEEITVEEMYQRMTKCNLEGDSQLKIKMPEDMSLNVFNLDYEYLMNKVLHNMGRYRTIHKDSAFNLNTLGQPLPPLEASSNSNNNEINYNTEERIKSIKKFVDINKKRRNKTQLALKRMILQEEVERMGTYEQLRERYQMRIEEHFKDLETVDDDIPFNEVESIE